MTRLSRLLFMAGTILAVPLAASASPIALTLTPAGFKAIGPESVSNPCIIAGTNCPHQPAAMGYNNFKQGGNISSYDAYSTTPTPPSNSPLADGVMGTPYTVGLLDNVLGTDHFNVAIDVNTNGNGNETLESFDVIINGVVAYDFPNPTLIGSPLANKGNGYADWTLGDISLANYSDASTVLFHAVWDNASGGAESFFLSGLNNLPCTNLDVCPPKPCTEPGSCDPPPVPEPASFALLGVGLLGLGLTRLHRT